MSSALANLPTARRAPPPAEFTGKARQFRAQLSAADDDLIRTLDEILKPLAARLRSGKPQFRPASLIDAERAWRTRMPQIGRLDLQIERTKLELRIREYRLCGGKFRSCAWDTARSETDVGIYVAELLVSPRYAAIPPMLSVASIGMHALARWFQRAFHATPDALTADLREIAHAHKAIIDRPALGDFIIATPNGRWRGQVVEAAVLGAVPIPLLSVRTFVN